MRFSLFFLLALLFVFSAFAQTVLRGSVRYADSKNSVVGCTVVVMDREGYGILAYAISDESGKFGLEFDSNMDTVLIKVNSMEIEEIRRLVRNESQEIFFLANPAVWDLREVVVESLKNPLTQKGDTLEYSVDGFKRPNDVVISDLLRRLPGIEVSENGMIRYEGRALQHFYVEGMDLLGGKYNLINRNLSVDAVESIQILENHQPIKILDSLVSSDRASLNIKLKNKNTWVGTGKIGLGASPLLWDIGVTPMLFGAGNQFLGSFQSNNTGTDLSEQLDPLTIEDLLAFEPQDEFRPWSGITKIVPSSVEKNRYAFNQSYLGTFNNLRKFGSGGELRSNVSYLDNQMDEEGEVQTLYFLPIDTVNVREVKSLQNRERRFSMDIGWTRNTKKAFVKNISEVKVNHLNQAGNSIFDSTLLNQNVTVPLVELQNSFQSILRLGNLLLQAKSELSYRNSDERFDIEPGRFENLLNEGNAYQQLSQKVGNHSFFSVNSLGFTKQISSKLVYTPTLGLKYQVENMESRINVRTSSEEKTLPAPFQNTVDFREFKPFFRSQVEFRREGLRVALDLPISYLSVSASDVGLAFDRDYSKGLVEGNLRVSYDFSQKLKSSLLISRINEIKSVQELHGGYLLRNFLSFQQRATEIPEVIAHKASYGLNFKDPLSSIFVSGRIGMSSSNQNTILVSEVLPSGEALYSAQDIANRSTDLNGNVRFGKYFSILATNIAVSGSWQNRIAQQIVNQVLSDIGGSVRGLAIDLDAKPTSIFGVNFKSSYNLILTEMDSRNLSEIQQLGLEGTLDVYLSENHAIQWKLEHFQNRIRNLEDSEKFSFMDIGYRMKLPRYKLNLSFVASNLLDNRFFQTFYSSSFMTVSQQYRLRPRQFALSAGFSF